MLDITIMGRTTARTTTHGPDVLAGVSGKPRTVLQVLALDPSATVAKDLLAETVWDGSPPRSWAVCLEAAVCRLRDALQPDGRKSVVTYPRAYGLADDVRVDLAGLQQRLDVATASGSCDLGLLSTWLRALQPSSLLAEVPYTAWAEDARRRLTDRVVDALTLTARRARQSGEVDDAVALLARAVALRPADEALVAALMADLITVGDRGRALRLFVGLQDRMREELGVDPSPGTRALYETALGSADADGAWGAREITLLARLIARGVDETPDLTLETVQLLASAAGRAAARLHKPAHLVYDAVS